MRLFAGCTFGVLLVISTFGQVTYTDKQHAAKGYPYASVDLDGDGVSDLISIGTEALAADSRWGFYVSLSHGDGTFAPPVFYGPPAPSGSSSLAIGDFDRDAHADIAFVNGSNKLFIFLNNGNGTFAAPIVKTMPHLLREVAASDFNRDRKLDLAFISNGTVVRALGNGDGTFQNTQFVGNTPNGADNIMASDFNGDGFADFATSFAHCDRGAGCVTNLYIFHGNGAGSFTPDTIHYDTDFYFYRTFDLDNGFGSEIVGTGAINGTSVIRVIRDFNSQAGGVYAVQDIALAKGVHTDRSALAESADLNGDGTEDLVVIESDNTSTYVALKPKIVCCLTDTYDPEEFLFNGDNVRAILVDRFNTGTRPDVLVKTGTIFASGTDHFLINTTDAPGFPNCDTPRAASGIRVCVPQPGGTYPYGVELRMGAIFTSPLRYTEFRLDGRPFDISFNAYANQAFFDGGTESMFNGPHVVSFYANTFDGRRINRQVSFNIVDPLACPAPTSPGISICDPPTASGETVPINVTGKTAVQTVRMQMWIDGKKVTDLGGNNIRLRVSEQPGVHTFNFYALDKNGTKVMATRKVTVQ